MCNFVPRFLAHETSSTSFYCHKGLIVRGSLGYLLKKSQSNFGGVYREARRHLLRVHFLSGSSMLAAQP